MTLAPAAQAQVPGPPLPGKFRAVVRYRIVAPRDIHVAHYDAMIAHLQKLDFEFDPPLEQHPQTDREDPYKNQIVGLVPGRNASKLLQNPSVATVLLVPDTFKLPETPESQVHVRLELSAGIPPARQRELGDQVRLILGLLGFKEAAGYDDHGYSKRPFTRIVGTIPAGQLDLLVRDLRTQPTDWLAPVFAPDQVPSPLRQMNPIIVAEVLPDPEPLKELALAPRSPEYLEKLSPDLYALTQNKSKQSHNIRVQIFLIGNPPSDDKDIRFEMTRVAPSLHIDGWLSPVVSGTVDVVDVPNLAALPFVSALRLTRPLGVQVDPGTKFDTDNDVALEKSGLAELHRQGFRGKGVRLAIIDTDFRGWERMVAEKKLPAGTSHVDLTAERDIDLLPAAAMGDPQAIGHGTQAALAAALAAPEARLTLVRTDGADPFQIYEIAQYFKGEHQSQSMRRRQDDIIADRMALRNRREELLKDRARILEDFTDESELDRSFGFLGPVVGWIFSDRELLYQRMKYQEKREKDLDDRFQRFVRLSDQIDSLKGIRLASSSLDWQSGYPTGGASTLSRWFHQHSQGKLLWYQAAGNTRGQAWTGLFQDADNNGILQFSQQPPPPGRWTNGVNFFGWQPYEGERGETLPVGARVRVTAQWREPHDRDYYTRPGEDFYLEPLADLRVNVLRQRDPQRKTLPADAFEAVARSNRLPARLEHQPNHSIYEHSVEFDVDKESRYALRIDRQLPTRWLLREDPDTKQLSFALLENLVPTGLRPRGVSTLPALERNWELRLRIFVEVLDDKHRPLGRIVFADHATDEGTLGVPADARGVVTVGALDAKGKPLASSAIGSPAFLALAAKPDIFSYAGLHVVPEGSATAYGTSLATPFAAGWAATLLSSGSSVERVLQAQRTHATK